MLFYFSRIPPGWTRESGGILPRGEGGLRALCAVPVLLVHKKGVEGLGSEGRAVVWRGERGRGGKKVGWTR